jgi:hypothetical protein
MQTTDCAIAALADMKNLSCASKEGPDIRCFPEAVEIRTKAEGECPRKRSRQILYREIGYYPPACHSFCRKHSFGRDIARIDAEANRLFGLD